MSLVLVCVLLISWSPIRAQASVLGGAALLFGDDAIAIILAVLAGLGVCVAVGSESSDLETRAIARNAMDAMEDAGKFVVDGGLTVYNSLSESWSYAVSTDLVQWLHGWLFESDVVSYNERYVDTFPTSESARNAYQEAMSYPYHLVFAPLPNYNWTLVGSDSPIEVVSSDSTGTIIKFGYYGGYTYSCQSSGKVTKTHRTSSSLHISGTLGSAVQPEITTTTQTKLGDVAPPGTDIETEYGEYIVIVAPNGVPDTGGDGGDDEQPKIPVLPVPYLPPSEIPNVPQKDIWKGNKVEIENPDTGDTPDPTTGTDTDDPDSGSNDPTTPTTGTDTDPDTGTDVPPADIADYSVDLTNFFPFCLPFDIYAFFELLAADPEAPHLEFDIPFPFMDEPWHLVIDLSAWDNVALLARRLELLGFIIGLCVFTREKFLRS